MPNEPTVVHRPVIWQNVHVDEYKSDFKWWSTHKPLSYSRWLSLRKDALVVLSIEFFGHRGSPDFRPKAMLTLTQRASHSNFSMCVKCSNGKQEWAVYRKNPNRDLSEGEGIKDRLMIHIHEVPRPYHEPPFRCTPRTPHTPTLPPNPNPSTASSLILQPWRPHLPPSPMPFVGADQRGERDSATNAAGLCPKYSEDLWAGRQVRIEVHAPALLCSGQRQNRHDVAVPVRAARHDLPKQAFAFQLGTAVHQNWGKLRSLGVRLSALPPCRNGPAGEIAVPAD